MSDISLSDHGPETTWSHGGLDYPMGRWTPPFGKPHEVAPGVRWLRMPLPLTLDHINLWLLDDSDRHGPGTAIVDTGMNAPVCQEVWQSLLPSIRVTRVIGTHFHPDHIGLAGWLSERTGAPLWMTRAEYLTGRAMQLDARDTPPPEAIAFALDAAWPEDAIDRMRKRGWRFFSTAMTPMPFAYQRISDGDRLDIGGRVWRVVVGSGHSPEHACLVCEDDHLMISGDQVLPMISSNVSIHAAEPLADPLGDWLSSIERFKDLPGDMLVLPSHNIPFHGLHERLDQLENGHLEQLRRLHDFCSEPRTVHECLPFLFRRPIGPSLIPLASGEALAHLRRLELDGRVFRKRDGTAWKFRAI
jgi:glyoxylase-like metal-dependent hydrolase (beta-lactamase superfamily II)